ncbi:MAG: DEAD/DEAH box helicase [Nanoarchaeota archaeon]
MIKLMEESKFKEPSEIQERTIPIAFAGKDIIGGSATGSGKTLAFGASIIEHSVKGKGIQALILTPTRELAEQVGKVLQKFSSYKQLHVTMVYGGVGISPQINALERAEIVVGTPGRILDHMERRTINLKNLKTLVLDEADRMLDMGFIDDVEKIIRACPKPRQTMLFSATISQDIEHIAKKHMVHPESVSVDSYVDPSLLKQVYYDVPKELKFSLLVHLLQNETSGLVMVFCNTRINADFVANNLINQQIEAMAIHGGLTQQKRDRIMQAFRSEKVYVLVCTDIAARGLDIKNVSHVYNYDSPKNSKEYIHRIGRTARAGKDGIAISLVSQRDYESFRNVLMDDSIKVDQLSVPTNIKRVFIRFDRRDDRRSFSGGRRSFGNRGDRSGRGGRNDRSHGQRRDSRPRRSFNRRY